tara:strand:+ start:723 stop:1154 length:432 start_codon:yes stop_codon:yes gene_type:complete
VLSVVRRKNIEEPVVYVQMSVLIILHHNNVQHSPESLWVKTHYVLKSIVRLLVHVIVFVKVKIVVIAKILRVHVAKIHPVLNVVEMATVVIPTPHVVVIRETRAVLMEHQNLVTEIHQIHQATQIEMVMDLNLPSLALVQVAA